MNCMSGGLDADPGVHLPAQPSQPLPPPLSHGESGATAAGTETALPAVRNGGDWRPPLPLGGVSKHIEWAYTEWEILLPD